MTIDLPCSERAPFEARQALKRLDPPLEPDVLGRMRVLVSELVTNAVKYGSGGIRIELSATPDVARAEIVDQGEGFAHQVRDLDDAKRVGGWGLVLVEELSDRWGAYEGSTHVWFEIDRRGAVPAGSS